MTTSATLPINAAPGTPTDRYASGLRALHWLIAVLVIAMIVLGVWIHYFKPADEATAHALYNLHESTGLTVLALMVVRVAIRLSTGAPRLPEGTPAGIRALATLNHLALYGLLFAMPIIGFLGANASGSPVVWYGVAAVPSLIGKQTHEEAHQYWVLHWWGALILVALVALHLSGAVYHGLIRRDGVVRHMA